ncbi:MAG: hypothetical protein ACYDA3_13525 [Gaiellaceae bacterium]
MSTRRNAVAFAGVGLAALAGVSIAIGRYGSAHRHGFIDATLTATVGTAIGTTLLAVFTAWLAWSSVREQRERDRPVLVVVGSPMWQRIRLTRDEPGGGRLVFALRNVGLGPALGVEVTARCDLTPDARITPAVVAAIAPGDLYSQLVVEVAFATEPPEDFGAARFVVYGTYRDRMQRGPYTILTQWTPPPSPVQPEHPSVRSTP